MLRASSDSNDMDLLYFPNMFCVTEVFPSIILAIDFLCLKLIVFFFFFLHILSNWIFYNFGYINNFFSCYRNFIRL